MDTPDQPTEDSLQRLRQQVLNPWEGPCFIKGAGLWLIAASGVGLYWLGSGPPAWNHDWHGALIVAGIFGPTIALIVAHGRIWNRQVIPLLDAVSQQNDPGNLEVLLFFAGTNSSDWIRRVKAPLLRLLSQIQHTDADPLSSNAQGRMHQALQENQESDPEIILAILTVLPHIGTIAAIPSVKPHAQGATRASRDPRIREAAQQCLAILNQRADGGEGPNRTLLRAASAPVASHTLLRPASAGEESPTEQLLRPPR